MPKGWSEQHIRQENHSARELKKLLDTYFESDKDYRVLVRVEVVGVTRLCLDFRLTFPGFRRVLIVGLSKLHEG
jgi:hypothetical protein